MAVPLKTGAMKHNATHADPMTMLRERLAALGYATRDGFRVHEVARILCVSKSQVYALVEEGAMDGVIDVSSQGAKQASLRFPKQSVERFWMQRIR